MPHYPGVLLSAAGILRRPVTLVIAGLGVMCGIPLGRLLHDPPWRAVVELPGAASSAPPAAPVPWMANLPQLHSAAPRKYDGLSPAEAEAQRAVDGLIASFEEWKEKERESFLSLPMPLVMAALELGARSDASLIMDRLPRKHAYFFGSLILSAWADRDPEAAWGHFLIGLIDRRLYPNIAPQFVRHMARRHWPLMEGVLQHPDKLLEEAAAEAWTQRMMDASADPAAVRRLAMEAPEGRARETALDRAMWILAPAHPLEAIALVEATQDDDRFRNRGNLAKHLARSHPDLALSFIERYPLDRQFDVIIDDDSSAFDVMGLTIRRDTASTLTALAKFTAEGRGHAEPGFAARIAEGLPRHMADWVPAAVSAAGDGASGAEFVAAMFSDCPWKDGGAAVPAIAAIQQPGLQAAAAGVWAARWAAVEPDAARAWAESLPPAARARALCSLWHEGTPPNATLAACTAAGTIPDANSLALMSEGAPEATASWIAAQPAASAWHMANVARSWAGADPAAAASWAAQLPDPELRVRIVTAVMQPWLNREPEAAVDWLEASPLDNDDRTFVCDLTGL